MKKQKKVVKIRVRDVIESLDDTELRKMQKDLDEGGVHLRDLVTNKITERENQHRAFCSVCSTEISPQSTTSYTLVFGPHDFRKKATFCALDCLEYFLSNLKKMRTQNAG
ncbi:MAG: hypothetical protein ABH879_04860 [archaeon]